jgi:hypothetical protein
MSKIFLALAGSRVFFCKADLVGVLFARVRRGLVFAVFRWS